MQYLVLHPSKTTSNLGATVVRTCRIVPDPTTKWKFRSGSRHLEGTPMRAIHLSTLIIVAAVLGSLVTLAAQKQMHRSTVFEWATLTMQPTQTGTRREVMRAPTPTLDELEIHITTLNVGQVSHPPHQHPEEELLIVKEGTVETLQNGKASRLGPGSIIFHASNDLHNIRNAGTTPATYHVIQWRVSGAAK
jgi:quercetin dioxygenase-like cupin family protein